MGTILAVLGLSLLLIAVVRGGKLDIETQSPITIKIQAPSGRLIVDLQNITDSSSYVCHLEERGTYLFSVSNPTNTTAHVRIVTTFYGFESDLIESSLALILAGTIFIVASYAMSLTRHKRREASTQGSTVHIDSETRMSNKL